MPRAQARGIRCFRVFPAAPGTAGVLFGCFFGSGRIPPFGASFSRPKRPIAPRTPDVSPRPAPTSTVSPGSRSTNEPPYSRPAAGCCGARRSRRACAARAFAWCRVPGSGSGGGRTFGRGAVPAIEREHSGAWRAAAPHATASHAAASARDGHASASAREARSRAAWHAATARTAAATRSCARGVCEAARTAARGRVRGFVSTRRDRPRRFACGAPDQRGGTGRTGPPASIGATRSPEPGTRRLRRRRCRRA